MLPGKLKHSSAVSFKSLIEISHFFLDIFQKLAAVRDQREWVTTSGAHKVSGPRGVPASVSWGDDSCAGSRALVVKPPHP